jgi:hypothetical protein
MIQFYVCIIFTGIILVLVSLGMIGYDRKKACDYSTKMNEKKEELEIIISDADQMICEMNKFSDYIVTQMELKNEEITTGLRLFEEEVNRLNNRISVNITENVRESITDNFTEINAESIVKNDMAVNGRVFEPIINVNNYRNKVQSKSKEKVVPINNKYKRVIQLSKNGISDTEIAKSLNMGKGEVQLILEMNK